MDIRYPIGRFEMDGELTDEKRRQCIQEIAEMPARLRAAVRGLTDEQIDTPYRDGGWTARQIVHHLADSHLNSYVRFKLAMTEESPGIKPYFEDRWAELADARSAPVEVSLTLLEALHQRWVLFLNSLALEDYSRTLNHPEQGIVKLGKNLCMYAWHGKHHVAHIVSLRERMGW